MWSLLLAIHTLFLTTGFFQVEGLPAGGKTLQALRDALLGPVKKIFIATSTEEGEEVTSGSGESLRIQDSISRPSTDGIVLGVLPPSDGQCTVHQTADALSIIERFPLSDTLGLNDMPDTPEKFVPAFARLIVSQSQDKINYVTTMFVLESLADLHIAPKTVKALKTISYIMMRAKKRKDDRRRVRMDDLISEALEYFYGNVSPQSKEKWLSLSDLILEATNENEDAAKQIVAFLKSEYQDFQGLLKHGDQQSLFEYVISYVDYSKEFYRHEASRIDRSRGN